MTWICIFWNNLNLELGWGKFEDSLNKSQSNFVALRGGEGFVRFINTPRSMGIKLSSACCITSFCVHKGRVITFSNTWAINMAWKLHWQCLFVQQSPRIDCIYGYIIEYGALLKLSLTDQFGCIGTPYKLCIWSTNEYSTGVCFIPILLPFWNGLLYLLRRHVIRMIDSYLVSNLNLFVYPRN